MLLFAEQRSDVIIEKALKCPLLHSILLSQLYCLGSCEGRRKQIDYRLLLAGESILIQDVLYAQCRFFEILCQFDCSLHRQQVNMRLITLSTSPSRQLDNQAKTDDIYFQLAVDTYNGIVGFSVA